jgi:CBS domain-containing protein
LGFDNVFDYAAGKMDWLGNGLPLEGRSSPRTLVLDFVQSIAATCALADSSDDIARKAADVDEIPVVDERNILLGIIRKAQSSSLANRRAEDLMDPAPITVRPTMTVEEAAALMNRNELSRVLVTTSEGKLVGFLSRQTADHAVHETKPGR